MNKLNNALQRSEQRVAPLQRQRQRQRGRPALVAARQSPTAAQSVAVSLAPAAKGAGR